jgi:hypothetical protein
MTDNPICKYCGLPIVTSKSQRFYLKGKAEPAHSNFNVCFMLLKQVIADGDDIIKARDAEIGQLQQQLQAEKVKVRRFEEFCSAFRDLEYTGVDVEKAK